MKKIVLFLFAMVLAVNLTACGSDNSASWQEQYDLGVRLLTEGNYEEAIIAFTAAIEIDPKQPAAYAKRGETYVILAEKALSDMMNDEAEEYLALAQADFEKALELDDTLVDAWLGLAEVLSRQGNSERVIEVLEEAREKTGGDQRILDRLEEANDKEKLADELMREGNYKDALDILKEIQEQQTEEPDKTGVGGLIGTLEQALTNGVTIYYIDDLGELRSVLRDHPSNAVLMLKAGDYAIGSDLQFNEYENLTVQGLGLTRILGDSDEDTVIRITSCTNFTLKGITVGHDIPTEEGRGCSAGVIDILRSEGVSIENCDIFGCGLFGIYSDSPLMMKDTCIRDCSEYIMSIYGPTTVLNCSFYGNGYRDPSECAIYMSSDGSMEIIGSNFMNNANPVFVSEEGECTVSDCVFSGNGWDE